MSEIDTEMHINIARQDQKLRANIANGYCSFIHLRICIYQQSSSIRNYQVRDSSQSYLNFFAALPRRPRRVPRQKTAPALSEGLPATMRPVRPCAGESLIGHGY